MIHHKIIKITFLLCLFFCYPSFAIESSTQREAIATPRSKRFYSSDRAKQYIAIGGKYSSDYNSRSYEANSRYLYQSNKFIHEGNFSYQLDYADTGSGKNKHYDIKKSELYDLSIASKAMIGSTKNYGIFYHRSLYDELSTYYYDNRFAAGLGRVFFNGALELDTSIGNHNIKKGYSEIDVVSSWRLNKKITDKITLVQRAYWFFDHQGLDNQLRTSLVYRLNNDVSFEVRHNFEKRRYHDSVKQGTINQINRSITIGLAFDLN